MLKWYTSNVDFLEKNKKKKIGSCFVAFILSNTVVQTDLKRVNSLSATKILMTSLSVIEIFEFPLMPSNLRTIHIR